MLKFLIATVALMSVGCAGMDRHEAGMGFSSDGDDHMLSAHYAEYKRDDFGFLASIGGGGGGPKGDDFDDIDSPFVPGPESVLSTKKETRVYRGNITLAGTYQFADNMAVYAGPSINIGQEFDQFEYSTPFSGSGGYHTTDGDLEFKVGGVVGFKYFIDGENAALGIQYDTGTQMLGVSIGFSF